MNTEIMGSMPHEPHTGLPVAGTIERAHRALRINLDPPYPLGDLVIGAKVVPDLLAGLQVEVTFVQQVRSRAPFLGFAGTARFSKTSNRIMIRVGGKSYVAAWHDVARVYTGSLESATVSLLRATPPPIIDADLVRAF